MYSREHAAVGAVASAAAGLALEWTPVGVAALVAYGVALSVFVDLDHFLVARVLAGDWRHLRAALRRPVRALTDQEWIFADLEFARTRLGTHAVALVALPTGTLVVAGESLAAFTALVLAVHVACDMLRDAGLA